MKNFKKIILLSAVVMVSVFLSACSISTKSDGAISSGNIFVSQDKGGTWSLVNSVPTVSEIPLNISAAEVSGFYPDPSDNLAVYLATKANGLYYSYNIAKGWNQANLNEASINSVAVNNNDKCLIYVAARNRLYRSDDCSRSFTQSYYDNSTDVLINDVLVDFYNPKNIYIATSRGEVIKSIDSGLSWRTIWRFDEAVVKLILSPLDSRRVFAATKTNKIYSFYSSTDTSNTSASSLSENFEASRFKDLNDVLVDLDLGAKFINLVAINDGDIYLATNKMILRTPDDGVTWEKLSLINPDEDSNILAMDVNPKDGNEIYYASATTFFKSVDGGVTWNSKRLPTSWQASDIMVDFENGNNIYLGTEQLPKDKNNGFLKVGLID